MKTATGKVIAGIVLAGLSATAVAAGIRVEIAPSSKGDRTVQIAADEFCKFYKELTGKAAEGDARLLLKVDPSISYDGYDAFSMKSDAKGAVLVGGGSVPGGGVD